MNYIMCFFSLKTTNKELALTTAKQLYRDIAGKIERNERLKQINTIELIEMWDKFLQSQISDVPHMGIVPKTYASKRYWLSNWREFILSPIIYIRIISRSSTDTIWIIITQHICRSVIEGDRQ